MDCRRSAIIQVSSIFFLLSCYLHGNNTCVRERFSSISLFRGRANNYNYFKGFNFSGNYLGIGKIFIIFFARGISVLFLSLKYGGGVPIIYLISFDRLLDIGLVRDL